MGCNQAKILPKQPTRVKTEPAPTPSHNSINLFSSISYKRDIKSNDSFNSSEEDYQFQESSQNYLETESLFYLRNEIKRLRKNLDSRHIRNFNLNLENLSKNDNFKVMIGQRIETYRDNISEKKKAIEPIESEPISAISIECENSIENEVIHKKEEFKISTTKKTRQPPFISNVIVPISQVSRRASNKIVYRKKKQEDNFTHRRTPLVDSMGRKVTTPIQQFYKKRDSKLSNQFDQIGDLIPVKTKVRREKLAPNLLWREVNIIKHTDIDNDKISYGSSKKKLLSRSSLTNSQIHRPRSKPNTVYKSPGILKMGLGISVDQFIKNSMESNGHQKLVDSLLKNRAEHIISPPRDFVRLKNGPSGSKLDNMMKMRTSSQSSSLFSMVADTDMKNSHTESENNMYERRRRNPLTVSKYGFVQPRLNKHGYIKPRVSKFCDQSRKLQKRGSLFRFEKSSNLENESLNRSQTAVFDSPKLDLGPKESKDPRKRLQKNLELSMLGNTLLDLTVGQDGIQHLNNYKILNKVGEGAFGLVYKAKDKLTKKIFVSKISYKAVKIIDLTKMQSLAKKSHTKVDPMIEVNILKKLVINQNNFRIT